MTGIVGASRAAGLSTRAMSAAVRKQHSQAQQRRIEVYRKYHLGGGSPEMRAKMQALGQS
jgi:hypothetical protein